MPPWIAAGMICAAVAVIVMVLIRNDNEQRRQCHRENCTTTECHYHEAGPRPRRQSSHGENTERYDTPPDFRHRQANDGDDCPICLDPIYLKPQQTLPCKHRLHSECYSSLRALSNICPVCRGQL